MKTWKQVSTKYPKYLKSKIKAPRIRLAALSRIEQYLDEQFPTLLYGYFNFNQVDKSELMGKFKVWNGGGLNGAESRVFNDFYKLSLLS